MEAHVTDRFPPISRLPPLFWKAPDPEQVSVRLFAVALVTLLVTLIFPELSTVTEPVPSAATNSEAKILEEAAEVAWNMPSINCPFEVAEPEIVMAVETNVGETESVVPTKAGEVTDRV
jgi:hypothetical protein